MASQSIYLIILSLENVIVSFVVVPHGSLLFPSLLQLAFFVANLVSLSLHFGVLRLHKTVKILAIALSFAGRVHVVGLFSVLHLGFEVGENRVFLQPISVCHFFDDLGSLFGSEVRLLVEELLFTVLSARFLVLGDLIQNVVLVALVSLELEGTSGLLQHLLLLDIAKELIALAFPLVLQIPQVILESVVRGLARLPLSQVVLFALVLVVGVDGIGALGVHHEGVAGVVGIADVFSVEGAADDVVQVLVRVSIKRTIVRHKIPIVVQVHIHRTGHLLRNADNRSAIVHINRLVTRMFHAG